MPISSDQRRDNYRRQTGRPYLTPRQRRRLDKKQNKMTRQTSRS